MRGSRTFHALLLCAWREVDLDPIIERVARWLDPPKEDPSLRIVRELVIMGFDVSNLSGREIMCLAEAWQDSAPRG